MIELPFPAKILWPNGRGHWGARHRAFAKHKQWAYNAMLAMASQAHLMTLRNRFERDPDATLRWSATFYPKTAHKIDPDNAVAALKSFIDGMAAALRTDDRRFQVPTIHFAEPVKNGKVVIVLEGA